MSDTFQDLRAALLTAAPVSTRDPGRGSASDTAGDTFIPANSPLAQLIDAIPSLNDNASGRQFREQITTGIASNTSVVDVYCPAASAAPYLQCASDFLDNGYLSGFFGNISGMSAALSQQLGSQGLSQVYFNNFAQAAVTDAIRMQVPSLVPSIKSDALATTLTGLNNELIARIPAAYVVMVTTDYAPMATPMAVLLQNPIDTAGDLKKAIMSEQFTAEVQEAMSQGPTAVDNVIWFEFNLWSILAAIVVNVDIEIPKFQAAGLIVPIQVQAGKWNTTYSSWFGGPINGASMVAIAGGSFVEAIQCEQSPNPNWPPLKFQNDNGYSVGYLENLTPPNPYYQPPSASCFQAGTPVLMAGGQAKAIETIVRGDIVDTHGGPRQVELVMRPGRDNRPLYRAEGVNAAFTATHPFPNGDRAGAAWLAIEPGELSSFLPTRAVGGVAPIIRGSVLQIRHGEGFVVKRVDVSECDEASADEPLYDLVLEDWSGTPAPYFVGGPDTWIAAAPEIPEMRIYPQVGIAILTALDIATPVLQDALSRDSKQWPRQVNRLINSLHSGALNAAFASPPDPPASILEQAAAGTPSLEFFLSGGEVDQRIAVVFEQLVHAFARRFRGQFATAQARSDFLRDTARVSLGAFDLEAAPGVRLPKGPLEIRCKLTQGQQERTGTITVDAPDDRHSVWVDEILALDEEPFAARADINVDIEIRKPDAIWARGCAAFHITEREFVHPFSLHLISQDQWAGTLFLDLCFGHGSAHASEHMSDPAAYSVAVGARIGTLINDAALALGSRG